MILHQNRLENCLVNSLRFCESVTYLEYRISPLAEVQDIAPMITISSTNACHLFDFWSASSLDPMMK